MPYTAASFAAKHNHKLAAHPAIAAKAAEQATAMEREGVDPGIAIATANKHASKSLFGAKDKPAKPKLREHGEKLFG